ncbi:cytochrome b-c1 complex subunit 7-like [Ptychodera flava]|uniref:cytochrome b-c1 complex subunit 7-like n=1 Tax=Ptychodera flava TaxID=63121 RepID=UPI00396A6AA9
MASGSMMSWLTRSRFFIGLQKWHYNAAGFNQLGLLRDDLIRETPEVKEAIRRLPEDVNNARLFRIKRALDLSLKHRVLPEEQWTKFEEDKPYLLPIIEEVQKEWKEMHEWNKV